MPNFCLVAAKVRGKMEKWCEENIRPGAYSARTGNASGPDKPAAATTPHQAAAVLFSILQHKM